MSHKENVSVTKIITKGNTIVVVKVQLWLSWRQSFCHSSYRFFRVEEFLFNLRPTVNQKRGYIIWTAPFQSYCHNNMKPTYWDQLTTLIKSQEKWVVSEFTTKSVRAQWYIVIHVEVTTETTVHKMITCIVHTICTLIKLWKCINNYACTNTCTSCAFVDVRSCTTTNAKFTHIYTAKSLHMHNNHCIISFKCWGRERAVKRDEKGSKM